MGSLMMEHRDLAVLSTVSDTNGENDRSQLGEEILDCEMSKWVKVDRSGNNGDSDDGDEGDDDDDDNDNGDDGDSDDDDDNDECACV